MPQIYVNIIAITLIVLTASSILVGIGTVGKTPKVRKPSDAVIGVVINTLVIAAVVALWVN